MCVYAFWIRDTKFILFFFSFHRMTKESPLGVGVMVLGISSALKCTIHLQSIIQYGRNAVESMVASFLQYLVSQRAFLSET